MNFKRRRSKNRRAGCKMCKPWKIDGAKKPRKRAEYVSLEELAHWMGMS